MKKNMKLTTSVFLTAIIALALSTIAVGLATQIMSNNSTHKLQQKQATAQVELGAEKINSYFTTQSEVLEAAAKIGKKHIDTVYDLTGNGIIYYFAMVDGTLYFGTGDDVDIDPRERDWYKHAVAAKKSYFEKPYVDAVSGEMVVTIATPVYDDKNTLVMVAGVDISATVIQNTINEINIDENGFCRILSKDGEVIAFTGNEKADGSTFTSYIEALDMSLEYTVSSGYENKPTIIISATLAVVAPIVVIISGIVLFFLVKRRMKPLAYMASLTEQMEHGDFTGSYEYSSDDDIGKMSKALLRMQSSLLATIDDIGRYSNALSCGNFSVTAEGTYEGSFEKIRVSLDGLREALNNVIGSIRGNIDNIASSTDNLASGADSLANVSTEQASLMAEMKKTINDFSGTVIHSVESTVKADAMMKSTKEIVTKSSDSVSRVSEAIHRIEENTDRISKIINTIEDISFQTNILALNAAVEAARAGASGKGFSVVADEVRQLAIKSSQAASDTAKLINDTVHDVNESGNYMRDTVTCFRSIVEQTDKTADIMNEIANGTATQKDVISAVTNNISEVSAAIENNAATAEESAAATREIDNLTQRLKSIVDVFSGAAEADKSTVTLSRRLTSKY